MINLFPFDRPVPLQQFLNARHGVEQPGTGSGITVITPTLQQADLLARMLESLARCHHLGEVEHIVVDGGSSDGTQALVRENPHTLLIEGPDRNSHHAMNKGLARATQPLIGFLNSDDQYHPETLAAVANHFHHHPECAVVRVPCYVSKEDRLVGGIETRVHEPEAAWDEYLHGTPAFNAHFFRRTVFETVGGFDDSFHIAADREFLLRMLLSGIRPQTISQGGMIYQLHEQSATLSADHAKIAAFLREHLIIADSLTRRAPAALQPSLTHWQTHEAFQLFKRAFRLGRYREGLDLLRDHGQRWLSLPHIYSHRKAVAARYGKRNAPEEMPPTMRREGAIP